MEDYAMPSEEAGYWVEHNIDKKDVERHHPSKGRKISRKYN